ncbi:carboxypeptidase-like regulatory domain-containing protein [Candidatus Scalindua japonica]|nr:carboxypeptidase-like regulatory domain-containing protein [Candidatus Scalindua japonica]
MLGKSYVFRLVIMCAVGMLPILGYAGNTFAASVGVIRGEVTGQRTNASMGNVDVQVTDLNGKLVKSVRSQKDGTFAVSQLPVGEYRVIAGNAPAKKVQVAMAPPVTQVDFQVPEKGYTAFGGMGAGLVAVVGLSVAAAVAGIVIAVNAQDDADDNSDDLDDLRQQLASP